MTIVVTGGGTGGHIYPALAVARALRSMRPDIEVVYIGAREGMERRIATEQGYPFRGVAARKIRRVISLGTVLAVCTLCRGFTEARRHLRELAPGAVLGTGGYVAAAAVLAARSRHIPVVLHEQNAIPGRTNLWLARYAQVVCVTFESSLAAFPADRVVCTGLPIRSGVVAEVTRSGARRSLGIPDDAFVLLVLGGSQGALAINRIVRQAMDMMPPGVYVLHQTGSGDTVEDRVPSAEGRYRAVPYLDEVTLPLAYAAADLALSRCGASTLAELAANALPALLVPYPAAYADHQTANAREVASRGAAVLIPQSELSPERLVEEVTRSIGDPGGRAAMAAASRQLARPDAASDVARRVLECALG